MRAALLGYASQNPATRRPQNPATRPRRRAKPALRPMHDLGPGMGFFVDGPQSRGADVGVDLRGDEALVAEELLDAADVGAAVEQVGGKTVTEGMGRGAEVQAVELEVFEQHPMDAAGGEAAAEAVGEDRSER